jgi:hypothetical protein
VSVTMFLTCLPAIGRSYPSRAANDPGVSDSVARVNAALSAPTYVPVPSFSCTRYKSRLVSFAGC